MVGGSELASIPGEGPTSHLSMGMWGSGRCCGWRWGGGPIGGLSHVYRGTTGIVYVAGWSRQEAREGYVPPELLSVRYSNSRSPSPLVSMVTAGFLLPLVSMVMWMVWIAGQRPAIHTIHITILTRGTPKAW